jgi:lipoprotein NlpI
MIRSDSNRLLVLFFLGVVMTGGSVTRGESVEELVMQAVKASDQRDYSRAVERATRAVELSPEHASAYMARARALFCSAKIAESISDFDKYVELAPAAEPRQWERGIAYYYAGKFKQGATQFEHYQTFDGHDVENSVWRFLCMAPDVGVERARAVMLPIENDRRIPMMQVFELYRGKLKPDDVLLAAKAGDPDPAVLAGRLFYAHLYLGLWFDAHGKQTEANRYIQLAADESLKLNPYINTYMWEVARIHQKLLRGELKRAK